MATKKPNTQSPSAQNRKARFNYFIEEEIEAGLVLTGTEVKSLRAGRISLNEAHAGEKDGELYLLNATIYPFEGGNRNNHEPTRPRKLLLHAKQVKKLMGKIKQKGYTIVPLKLYFNSRGFAKVRIGLAVGKKEYEKRDTIKKREWDREKSRLLKRK